MIKLAVLLLVIPLASSSISRVKQQTSLKIEVAEIQANKGEVIVAIYNNKETWLEKPYVKKLYRVKKA